MVVCRKLADNRQRVSNKLNACRSVIIRGDPRPGFAIALQSGSTSRLNGLRSLHVATPERCRTRMTNFKAAVVQNKSPLDSFVRSGPS